MTHEQKIAVARKWIQACGGDAETAIVAAIDHVVGTYEQTMTKLAGSEDPIALTTTLAEVVGRQLGALDVKLVEATALLRGIEWAGKNGICPECGKWPATTETLDSGEIRPVPGGHAERCAIGAFLSRRGPIPRNVMHPGPAAPLCVVCLAPAVVMVGGLSLCRTDADAARVAEASKDVDKMREVDEFEEARTEAMVDGGTAIWFCRNCGVFCKVFTSCPHEPADPADRCARPGCGVGRGAGLHAEPGRPDFHHFLSPVTP